MGLDNRGLCASCSENVVLHKYQVSMLLLDHRTTACLPVIRGDAGLSAKVCGKRGERASLLSCCGFTSPNKFAF
jgi:hypothetical protein